MRNDRFFAGLSAYVIFVAAVQATTIAMSLAKAAISAPVAWGILTVSATAGCLTYWLSCRSRPGPVDVERVSPASHWKLSLPVMLFAAGCYVALWILACFTPDLSCDGNTYHLPCIHIWAMKGYVHWVNGGYQEARFMNGYPKGVELVSFVLVKAFGSCLASAGNLTLLPLGILGVICLARMMGASRPFSMLAGAAYVMIPVNIGQAATTYVDSGFASCVIAFAASLLFVISRLARGGAFMPWAALPALGASMGLAIAGKGTGGLIVAVGLTVLAVHIAARAFASREPGRGRFLFLAAAFAFVVTAGLIAVAVGGFWYVRNYLIMGNPLYPAGVTVAGRQVFAGISVAKMIGAGECIPRAMRSWPEYVKVLFVWAQAGMNGCHWPVPMWVIDDRLGGLGHFWFLGCVPAILAMLAAAVFRPGEARRSMVFSLLAAIGVAFLATPMNWLARYTLWIYALGLPCVAAAASAVTGRRVPAMKGGTSERPAGGNDLAAKSRAGKFLIWPARLWLAACILTLLTEGTLALLLNVAWAKCPGIYDAKHLLPALLEEWRRPICYIMPELNGTVFDQILSGDAAVAVGRLDTQQESGTFKVEILGQLSLPIGRRAVLPIPERVDEAAVAALRAQKVRYVIWDDTVPLPDSLSQAADRVCRPPGFLVVVLR